MRQNRRHDFRDLLNESSFASHVDRLDNDEASKVLAAEDETLERVTHTVRPKVRRSRVVLAGLAAGSLAAFVAVIGVGLTSPEPQSSLAYPPMLQYSRVTSAAPTLEGVSAGSTLERLARSAASRRPSDSRMFQVSTWERGREMADVGSMELLPLITSTVEIVGNGRAEIALTLGPALGPEGSIISLPGANDQILDERTVAVPEIAASGRDQDALGSLPSAELCSSGEQRGECLLRNVSELFAVDTPSPLLASSLWKALANEPSITSLGTVRDRRGRAALAFTSTDSPTTQTVLLISPSGEYLGFETVERSSNPREAPTVVGVAIRD